MRIVDFVSQRHLWSDPTPWEAFVPMSPFEKDETALGRRERYTAWYQLDPNADIRIDGGAMCAAIERAYTKVAEDFQGLVATDLTFLVCPMSAEFRFIRERMSGVSGAASRNAVILYLNPDPESNWEHALYRAVLHETQHTVRYRFSNPYDRFIDWVISEGMAEQYVSESCPGEADSPWAVSASINTLRQLLPTYRSFWDGWQPPNGTATHWFFGSAEHGVPLWSGYSLGFAIVGRHGRREPWCEFVKQPSDAFRNVEI